MMATTHGFMGALLALPLYFIAPELFLVGVLAAFLGGVFPDLDLYFGHRRTFHFPVYYNILWVLFLPVFVLFPSVYTVCLFFSLLSAGVHCYFDRFGGPKDSRPWKNDSGEAVYSHYHGSWYSAEKVIPYDGSKEDLLLLLIISAPTLYLIEGELRLIGIGLVIFSAFYTAFRKKGMEVVPDRFLRTVE